MRDHVIAAKFTTPQVARLASVEPRNLSYWIDSGLVRPERRARGRGIGLGHEFGFRGLVEVRTIRDLRDQGLSLQRIRRALDALRRHWPEAGDLGAGAKLVTDGRDALLVLDRERFVSLLEAPGQTAWRSVVDVGRIAGELRAAVAREARAA